MNDLTLREGDFVTSRRNSPEIIGRVIAVYQRSRQADVVWPFSEGEDDAALCEFDDLTKYAPSPRKALGA